MATQGITAIGTAATFNSNSLGEIESISSGGRTLNIVPIATVASTNSYVEKIAGFLDEGDFTFDCIYDGSNAGVYNDLNTDFQLKAAQTLLITLSDTSSFSMSALMSSLSPAVFSEGDGVVRFSVSFAVSGQITYTDVAP